MHDPNWNHLAPLIGVQAWIVRELLALRSDVALLQGKAKPSRRKTLLHILILAVAPWIGLLILTTGCMPLPATA